MGFKKPFILFLTLLSLGFASEGYVQPWGKDSSVAFPQEKQKNQIIPNSFLFAIAKNLIIFHQKVISPADGPRSHFSPVSSRYMLLSIKKYGLLKGYLKGCNRLIRENSDPWVYDTVIIKDEKVKYDPP